MPVWCMCGACVVPVWCLCGACVVAGWFNCSLFRHSGSALNVLFAALGRSGGREGVNLALEYVVPMWCLRVWWLAFRKLLLNRVGQSRIYALCMTVCLVIFLPNTPYIHCAVMVWPTLGMVSALKGRSRLKRTKVSTSCCMSVLLHAPVSRCMSRVGQNRISAPYMTVCLVISLLKIPHVHRIYL